MIDLILVNSFRKFKAEERDGNDPGLINAFANPAFK
jgi:hypothetical protein